MNCHSCLKYILLFLLTVNVAIQTVEAYSVLRSTQDKMPDISTLADPVIVDTKTENFPPTLDTILSPSRPTQNKRAIVSSNVVMVWRASDGQSSGHHIFDHATISKIEALGRIMSQEDFQELLERAKGMPTNEFVSLLDHPYFKEQILLAKNEIR